MMANSPLQIYAVVIGARLYDTFFNVLAGFGFIFIPLGAAFFQGMRPFFEQEATAAGTTALRRAGLYLLIYFAGFVLFAVPICPLNVQGITYTPVCRPSAEPSTFGNTGTTYDKVFQNIQYQRIFLPLGLDLALAAVSGITNALMTALPCQTDVQAMQDTINTTALTPELSDQIGRFMNECYLPAKAAFQGQKPDPSDYKNVLRNYGGSSDLNWIGSHVLQQLYYGQLTPSAPVQGFSAAEYPYVYQSYNQKSGTHSGKWGYPTCEQWWNTPVTGIKAQLVARANSHAPDNPHISSESLSGHLEKWWRSVKNPSGFGSRISSSDIIARGVLNGQGTSQGGFGDNFGGEFDFNGSNPERITPFGLADNMTPMAGQLMAQAGLGISRIESAVKRRELAMEIPIVQALLLAFLLAIGPLVLVCGGYHSSVAVPYYFLTASTVFVSFLESFIHYFENSLHASLSYGSYAFGDSSMLYNVFTFLYQYVPLLFLMVMSLAGMGVGNAVSGALSASQNGGSQLTRKVISKSSGGIL